MGRIAKRGALLLLAVQMTLGCAPLTSSESAGVDQEITRNILWRYRNDDRFSEIRVICENHVIVLEGRVSDEQAARDALQVAQDQARGGSVISNLQVMQR